jgi:hypothetical protein
MSSPESKIELTRPSRELDALVAEKVMGEQVRGTWIIDGVRPDGIPNRQCPVEHYSSDIASAWEVVEKLADLGWCIELKHYPKGSPQGPKWLVFLWREFDAGEGEIIREPAFQLPADTAPLAICLAALKAAGALPAKD